MKVKCRNAAPAEQLQILAMDQSDLIHPNIQHCSIRKNLNSHLVSSFLIARFLDRNCAVLLGIQPLGKKYRLIKVAVARLNRGVGANVQALFLDDIGECSWCSLLHGFAEIAATAAGMTESDKIERQREAFIAMRPVNKQSSLLESGLRKICQTDEAAVCWYRLQWAKRVRI